MNQQVGNYLLSGSGISDSSRSPFLVMAGLDPHLPGSCPEACHASAAGVDAPLRSSPGQAGG